MKPTIHRSHRNCFSFLVIHSQIVIDSHRRTLDVFPKNFQHDIPEQITNGPHFS